MHVYLSASRESVTTLHQVRHRRVGRSTGERPFARYNGLLDGGRRARSPRRPGAQPQGHHRPAPAERTHLHHRALGLREVEPCLRHDLRGGAAAVRRVALGLRAPVPADDGEARRRLDRRALSPAISIDQKTTSRNPRSTVGTVTEIYDYLRLLYARVGRPHCPICGRPIAGQAIDSIVEQILALPEGTRFTVNAPVVRDRKGEYRDLFEELRNEGFTRVKVDGEQYLLEEPPTLDKKFKHTIEVVVDRLVMKEDLRLRLTQSVETAVALAEGLVAIDLVETGESAHLLGAVRVPRARRLAARAAAADLLVQLAARRLPALHRPRRAAGDRPRPARARPEPLDRRGRARPVGGRQLELLRVGDPGDRRALRDRRSTGRGRSSPRSSRATSSTARSGDKVYVTYRNRMGRRRAYMLAFEGIVASLAAPLPRDRQLDASASGSRSTCRSGRARSARARG